jgi:hypothetical protein
MSSSPVNTGTRKLMTHAANAPLKPTTTPKQSLLLRYRTWQYDRIINSTTKCVFLRKFDASKFNTPTGINLSEVDAVYVRLNQMLFTGMLDNLTHVPPDTDVFHFQVYLSRTRHCT